MNTIRLVIDVLLIMVFMALVVPKEVYKDTLKWGKKHYKAVGMIIFVILLLTFNRTYICSIIRSLSHIKLKVYLFMVPLVYFILWLTIYMGSGNAAYYAKKIYYILVLVVDICIINHLDFSQFEVSNTFGLPRPLYVGGLISIGIFILAFVLDLLILSGGSIKEFSFAGATFVKEDLKKNIKENANNIQILLDKIEAEYNAVQQFEAYIEKADIKTKLEEKLDTFDWCEEFRALAQYYCSFQKEEIVAECIVVEEGMNLSDRLVVAYDISNMKSTRVCKNLLDKKSYFLQAQEQLLFIPYEPTFFNHKIIVVLRGKSNVVQVEQRFILNIFKRFEDYVTTVIAELPE